VNISQIPARLREERRHVEEAIVDLERLAQGRLPRTGRPPAPRRLASVNPSQSRNGQNGSNDAPDLSPPQTWLC
jgi:hypothetical protein